MRRVLIKREIEFIRIFIRVLAHLPLLPLLLKVVLLLVVEMRHELVLQGLVCRYPHARPEDKQLLDQVQGLGTGPRDKQVKWTALAPVELQVLEHGVGDRGVDLFQVDLVGFACYLYYPADLV